jgi:hypothetical protein
MLLASICTAYAFTASVKVMKKLPLYGHVDYQPRTGLWNYFSVFYYWWKRKMISLRWSRNYHHYSNLKWINQTQAG